MIVFIILSVHTENIKNIRIIKCVFDLKVVIIIYQHTIKYRHHLE